MIGNNLHCDVTLQCQDGPVHVSGLLLASISPLFKQLGILGWDTDYVMLPDFCVSFLYCVNISIVFFKEYIKLSRCKSVRTQNVST